MSQPPLPGQYGYPPAFGNPIGSNGSWTGPQQDHGAYGRPQGGLQGGYEGYGAYGQESSAGYGQAQGTYGQPQAGYGQPAGHVGPVAPDSGSAGLPPRGVPIPVTQDVVVFRASATRSARMAMLVTGGFGLVVLAGAIYNFVDGKFGIGILLILLGLLLLAAVALMMTVRTTLDATGIHTGSALGSKDFPWPTSRTGLFVRVKIAGGKAALVANDAQAMLVTPEGKPVILAGLTWMGPLPNRLEAKGMAELDRIWAWAVARGYTRETGQYTELNVHGPRRLIQIQRRHQEERYGLV